MLIHIFLVMIALAICTLAVISAARIASKAGWSPIVALLPVYNLFVFLNLIGKPRWWIFPLTLNVPVYIIGYYCPDKPLWLSLLTIMMLCTQIGFWIWGYNMLAKCFGKDEGFTVGLALVTPVFLAILAFDDSEYRGPVGNWNEYDAYNRERMEATFDFEREQRDRISRNQ